MSHNSEHHKKSCEFAVDLIKQFLALACGGIAFVIGLVFSEHAELLDKVTVSASLCFFAASVICGWLGYMNIIGKVSRKDDYNIYGGFMQIVSIVQILLFLLAVGILFFPTMKNAGLSHALPKVEAGSK